MVKVLIRAGVLTGHRKRGQRELRVQGTIEGKHIPRAGDWLRVQMPAAPPRFEDPTFRFLIEGIEVCWMKDVEYIEFAAAASFRDLVHLALVHEWQVIGGLEELSPDQRSFVECRAGLCGHSDHRAPAR